MKKLIFQMSDKERKILSRNEYLNIEREFHDKYSKTLNWDSPVTEYFSYEDDSLDSEKLQSYFDLKLGNVVEKKILDIGSGFGNSALNLAKRGAIVTSIDISPRLIEGCRYRAAKNGLVLNFQVMDAGNLHFDENYFDIILSFRTIHHLPILEDFFKEAYRCLKPGGFILIVEPQKFNPFVEFGRKFIRNSESSRTPTEHPLIPADIRIFRSIFYNIENHEFIFLSAASRFFNLLKLKKVYNYSAKFLSKIDELLWHIRFLRPFYWQVVLKGYKTM